MAVGIKHPEYIGHEVFSQLKELASFYDFLSYHVMTRITMGTKAYFNLDTYVFSSIQGTLESIHDILLKGRINDSFTLLRKYYDSTIINIYSNLYLDDHLSLDNIIVEKIDNWRKGTERLPEYRIMSKYIKDSPKLLPITTLLNKDIRYKHIRDRCNNHTHYNYYKHVMHNDNEIYIQDRIEQLNYLSEDLREVFIQHFAYYFYLRDTYMMSSDYIDHLDCGLEPPDDSQYWVAKYIQDIFNDVIKVNRPDIAEEIKSNTCMHLE